MCDENTFATAYRSDLRDEMLREVAFPDDRWFRTAMSRTEADRMDAYRSGLGHVQLAYSRMFDGLAGMFRQ